MMPRNVLVRALLLGALLSGGLLLAQHRPGVDTSSKGHPNLNAAQRLCQQAYEKLVAAQGANEFDMEGHAKKAEELLDKANQELKAAAEAANKSK